MLAVYKILFGEDIADLSKIEIDDFELDKGVRYLYMEEVDDKMQMKEARETFSWEIVENFHDFDSLDSLRFGNAWNEISLK